MKVKAKVLRTFRNKYSKGLHKAGETVEVSKKRFKEINASKHGQLIEEVKEE